MKYRIVKYENNWRIQKKILWWWTWVCNEWQGYPNDGEPTDFRSYELAEKKMEKLK